MAKTLLQIQNISSNVFNLDLMLNYPRQFIRHTFNPGEIFDVTGLASAADLNQNPTFTDLTNPNRVNAAGVSTGAIFQMIEVPGTDDIIGSGLGAQDNQGFGVVYSIDIPLTSGGSSGTAGDVVVCASVPRTMRIIDAFVVLSTSVASSTGTLYSAVSAGGTQLSEPIATATNGLSRAAGTTMTALPLLAAGSAVYFHRSDRSIVGTLVVLCVNSAV